MSSPKQIAANRRNALLSSGPVTAEGKRRSRCNALRHGLTAETVIAALEDRDDYEAFEAAVTADYNAESAVQRELVLRLASILWRLRRANRIETELFDALAEKPVDDSYPTSRWSLQYATEVAGCQSRELGRQPKRTAETFLRLAEQPTYAFDRLSRYEYLLWRQVRQIILALDSSRQCKRGLSSIRFPFSFYGRDRHSEEA